MRLISWIHFFLMPKMGEFSSHNPVCPCYYSPEGGIQIIQALGRHQKEWYFNISSTILYNFCYEFNRLICASGRSYQYLSSTSNLHQINQLITTFIAPDIESTFDHLINNYSPLDSQKSLNGPLSGRSLNNLLLLFHWWHIVSPPPKRIIK